MQKEFVLIGGPGAGKRIWLEVFDEGRPKLHEVMYHEDLPLEASRRDDLVSAMKAEKAYIYRVRSLQSFRGLYWVLHYGYEEDLVPDLLQGYKK